MQQKSYLDWKSPIKIENIFSDLIRLRCVSVERDNIYFIEGRPVEKGRNVIVKIDSQGNEKDLLPSPFNARTRVHEYGGKSYTVKNGIVYFANFDDQRIYKVENEKIIPLTPERNKDGSLGKYASLNVVKNKLIFVYELEYENKENINCIAYIDLDSEEINEPVILVDGRDFYGDVVTHENKIVWQEWEHPHMPWEYTELFIADLEADKLTNIFKIAGGENISICLPKFSPKGILYFVMDGVDEEDSPKNWWNIYKYEYISDNAIVRPVTKELAEFGVPQWNFGNSNYTFIGEDIVAIKVSGGEEKLVKIKLDKSYDNASPISEIKTNFSGFNFIQSLNRDLVFIGSHHSKNSELVKVSLNGDVTTLKVSSHLELQDKDISIPEHISFPTKSGRCYAYLYLPKNSQFEAPSGEKPPLLVMAHGGPTGGTSAGFSLVKQFWTSSGYAILDVNYTGSVGYGRKYRDALYGLWGVIDAQDVADGVQYLIDKDLIDPNKVAVTGGSAGGYMVQRVLTEYPELFTVGASYFGIGNLITLCKETHKFESRYISQLVDAKYPEDVDKIKDRSPINHLDKLKAPMIILQGSDDKIVTPNNSREMAKILDKKGIMNEYYEYEGEAHGFRKKENKIDSLQKEFNFYKKVFLR
jgi:acetyl esterase/lipase